MSSGNLSELPSKGNHDHSSDASRYSAVALTSRARIVRRKAPFILPGLPRQDGPSTYQRTSFDRVLPGDQQHPATYPRQEIPFPSSQLDQGTKQTRAAEESIGAFDLSATGLYSNLHPSALHHHCAFRHYA